MYEELVKRLREAPNDWPDADLHYEAADAIEALQAGEKKFLRNISALEMENENLKRAMRWIPMTGEAPLEVGDDGYNGYLVYANGYYAIADYAKDKYDNVPYFHVDGEMEPDVTHYIPLPPPPKEEA